PRRQEGGTKAPPQGPTIRVNGGNSLQAIVLYAMVKMCWTSPSGVKEYQEKDKNRIKTGQKREACQSREKFKSVAVERGRKTEENKKRMAKNAYAYQKLFKIKEMKKRKGQKCKFMKVDIFHACKQYGHVVDSFIPFKRDKYGKRFGFVRFINVFNKERLVDNLCTIWIGRYKIQANIAHFQRLQGKSSSNVKHNGGYA
nr:nucleotide-binding alpha-beta plait domain-containing protein [Tanacetum cinerariifolium]